MKYYFLVVLTILRNLVQAKLSFSLMLLCARIFPQKNPVRGTLILGSGYIYKGHYSNRVYVSSHWMLWLKSSQIFLIPIFIPPL